MGAAIPTGTAAEVLAHLREHLARNEEDRQLRNKARVRAAGALLTDGSYTVSADRVAKLRAALQDDDQRLFDPDVLTLDGWTQKTLDGGKLAWKGPKTSPPPPPPQDLPASASPASRTWANYLATMAEPKGWAKRQRRRAFLLGSSLSKWCREQDPVKLARRAGPDEQELFDPELLRDDGWSVA